MAAIPPPAAASTAAARAAGLRYVTDARPGFTRETDRNGFRYLDPAGKVIRDAEVLRRIKALAIPPAWTGVWISPHENGHIQAVGRDARGRKQYRYHARWREVRDESKYERMTAFAEALPALRRRVAKDLRRTGMPREKVLAAVVRLLETSLIRVGNDEYAQTNNSFGLTTIRNRHARVRGGRVNFSFVGKSGKKHSIDLHDPQLATIVRHCQDLPGQELFAYLDDAGVPHDVSSDDVNSYLREISGAEFSAKDFRTWAGTVLAAIALREFEDFASTREAKRNITQAVEAVAKMLGNTPSVCRKCYVHPGVLECYLQKQTIATLRKNANQRLAKSLTQLKPEEAAVMMMLRERLSTSRQSGGQKVATLLSPRKRRQRA